MNLGAEEPSTSMLSISLKWNKDVYEFQIPAAAPTTTTGRLLKEKIYQLTQVPAERQKIMGKGYWKGLLKDDFRFSTLSVSTLKLSMMGSAEVLVKPTTITTFVEDLTKEQQEQAAIQEFQESLALVTGMIPAIQTLPQHRNKDKHRQSDEFYSYNRMVHGLPQYQIERLLEDQFQPNDKKDTPNLKGRVVMTLGLELQRAYINDLATLSDGTLISGLEDGHIQLWKHGERVLDLIHLQAISNNSTRGVESVLALQTNTQAAFVTGGRGVVRVWTKEREQIVSTLPAWCKFNATTVAPGMFYAWPLALL
ncbi:hypothetical protein IV203_033805 [Nitzschia inconspicua]|uniref:ubiquitinyl hydrolase 1 n=1 Tax=Nitzschia inconspicua TaxID=303405 RepID=A0A9K3M6N6_9STRA|nr:hypothetical protein IV203_033805 [Nitzschia inconspicua]